MFVCEKCHEQDRLVTKCEFSADDHRTIHLIGACDICGNDDGSHLLWCHGYEKLKNLEGKNASTK